MHVESVFIQTDHFIKSFVGVLCFYCMEFGSWFSWLGELMITHRCPDSTETREEL